MLKAEFLGQLQKALSALPAAEVERQLNYYSELIDDMMEDGLSEIEAITRLGRVEDIRENILREQPLPLLVKNAARPKNGWTALSVIFLILGFPVWGSLLIAFFAVVCSIYIAIWAILFAAFAVVVSFGIAGVAMIVYAVIRLGMGAGSVLWTIGAAMLLLGLCVLGFPLAAALAKLVVKGTAAVGRWVKSLFIRKEAK